MLPQWHVKDPGHSAKSAGVQVTSKHAYTLDPMKSEWADYAAVQKYYGNLSGNELTGNLSRSSWPQLSHLAESLWTEPGLSSGISMRELISTLKKKIVKSTGRERMVEHSTKILTSEEKAITTTINVGCHY